MSRRKKSNPSNLLTPREQLDLFMERGEELWNSPARRAGLKISLNMKWNADHELLRINSEEPDVEDFRSFLLIFRKFISPNSHIYLPKIYKICHQYLTDDRCKEYLAEARGIWQDLQKVSGTGMTLTVDSHQLSPKEVVDLWINSHYFHDDVAGMKMLKKLLPYQLATARHIFFDYVIETTRVIKHLGQSIHVANKRGWFRIS